MGFADAIFECDSAAEKQQTASIEQKSAKDGESGVGWQARQGGKPHSTIEGLSDSERTLSPSSKAIWIAIEFDSWFA